ncbi:MAG: hypothetical protein KBI47_08830 [Armatimonadetes bacterium]|nr:hypothetical protein [Armatimonadota bacterium]
MLRPILHIMTVGTSAFGKKSRLHPLCNVPRQHLDIEGIGNESLVSTDGEDQPGNDLESHCQIAGVLVDRLNQLSPSQETGDTPPAGADFLPAEISSLHAFYQQDEERNGSSPQEVDKVVLLCSDTNAGLTAGFAIQKYIQGHTSRTGNHRAAFDGWITGPPQLVVVGGLQSLNADTFRDTGLNKLVEAVQNAIAPHRETHRIVINLTGGYKGAIPHLVLIASAYEDVEVIYKYETSAATVTLPAMPLALDLPMWRDYRWLLRALPHLGTGGKLLQKDVPRPVRALFQVDANGVAKGNFLYGLCKREYDRHADDAFSMHGRGELLLDLLDSKPELQKWLREHIERWQYAWLGDQVPEMAEHQRGHTQRALELASQIIRPAFGSEGERFLNDTELAVFIAAVWLHDIGHAGKQFRAAGKIYVVDGFPTLIRDWHHFLAAQMLEDDIDAIKHGRDGAFFHRPQDGCTDTAIGFIRAVALVARHHRRRLPLNGEQSKTPLPGGNTADAPFGERECTVQVGSETVRWRLLTALYRVVDAADVQGERVGTEQYQKALAELSVRQADAMLDEAEWQLGRRPCPLASWAEEQSKTLGNLRDRMCAVRQDPECESKSRELQQTDEAVADAVARLCGTRADGVADAYYAYRARVLGLLSSAVFKQRQPGHWKKHAGVHAVVFRHERIDDWHQVTPLIFVKQDGSGKRPEDRASEALKDISSELKEQGVLEIFEEAKLRFVADKVNQVTTYQEDDILLFEGTSS